MKASILKMRMAVVAAFITLCAATAVAQTARKHVIERGETLESIATRYGVTTEEIIKLNPDAAQFVYVGMELTLPEKPVETAAGDTTTAEPSSPAASVVTETVDANGKKRYVATTTEKPKGGRTDYGKTGNFEKEVFAGVSLNSYVGSDIKDANLKIGFHLGFTGRYFISDALFMEGSFLVSTKGYKANTSGSSGQYWDDEGANYDYEYDITMVTYNFDIPINIGYNIALTDNSSLKVKAGPYLTYAFSGKLKEKGYETYYPDIHSSETEHIDKSTNICDIEGFKNFGVGIGVGLSYDFSNFSISATYQHGLTKVLKKSKVYEQNILITLGYKI